MKARVPESRRCTRGGGTGVISCNSPQLMTADLDDVPGRWCSHLRARSVSRPNTHELFHNLNSEMEKKKKKITLYVKLWWDKDEKKRGAVIWWVCGLCALLQQFALLPRLQRTNCVSDSSSLSYKVTPTYCQCVCVCVCAFKRTERILNAVMCRGWTHKQEQLWGTLTPSSI